MKKKKSLKSLKKKAWDLFSKYIRQRDKGVCISCGKKDHWKNMQAGHFFHGSLNFDEQNVAAQCPRCNKWLHGNLANYAIALTKLYGDGILDELREKKNKVEKLSRGDLEEIIAKYKELVHE